MNEFFDMDLPENEVSTWIMVSSLLNAHLNGIDPDTRRFYYERLA